MIKTNKLSNEIMVRYTNQQLGQLKNQANKLGLNTSTYIRMISIKYGK